MGSARDCADARIEEDPGCGRTLNVVTEYVLDSWPWGRAGVRLSVDERKRRRRRIQVTRAEDSRRAEEEHRDAHSRWEHGLVAPWRITYALDVGEHHGAEVDIACGAVEPAVDEWESGVRYPTFEQLVLLSELTGFAVAWFVRDEEPLDIRSTSMWTHMTARERRRWKGPVLQFHEDAVADCPGTVEYRESHLF